MDVLVKVYFKNKIDIDKDRDRMERGLYDKFLDKKLIYNIETKGRFLYFTKKYKELNFYKLLAELGSRDCSKLRRTETGFIILNYDELSEDNLISVITFELNIKEIINS